MLIALTGTIAAMVAIGKAIDSTVGVFGRFSKFLSGFNAQANQTAIVIMGIVAAMALLAVAIAAINGKTADIDKTFGKVSNFTNGMQAQQKAQYYASGTDYAPGGMAWVGEQGPEKVYLPTGSKVINSAESQKMSGGDTYILHTNIDAKNIKDWTDVVNFMQQSKYTVRAGRSKL